MENLEFDIVELYPLYGVPHLRLMFSAQIYIPSLDMDIRGWHVQYKVNEPSFVIEPMGREYDFDERKPVTFPILSNVNSGFIAKIKKRLLEEAAKKFKNFNFPKGFPKNFWKYHELKNPDSKKSPPVPEKKNQFAKYQKKLNDYKTPPKKGKRNTYVKSPGRG